jgi:hypothetical protein
MNLSGMTESTMDSHPTLPGRRVFGLIFGLSIALLAVFAAGMAIGYNSVYRHATVASLAPDAGARR